MRGWPLWEGGDHGLFSRHTCWNDSARRERIDQSAAGAGSTYRSGAGALPAAGVSQQPLLQVPQELQAPHWLHGPQSIIGLYPTTPIAGPAQLASAAYAQLGSA